MSDRYFVGWGWRREVSYDLVVQLHLELLVSGLCLGVGAEGPVEYQQLRGNGQ